MEVSAVAFSARVLADSVAANGCELTTVEVTLPRIVLAEFNTHRMFSRNSASSRAIPFVKQLRRILDDPFVPISWGVNQPGMQAAEVLSAAEQVDAQRLWLVGRDLEVLAAVQLAGGLSSIDDEGLQERLAELQSRYKTEQLLGAPLSTPLHKQVINRLLEPYMWQTIIVTATDWENFWALRINEDAQPEIRRAAELMKQAHDVSVPTLLADDEWHLPLIQQDEYDWARANPQEACKVSAGRCARISYLTHDGMRDLAKDIELCDTLMAKGHMSPLEHVARPMSADEYAASHYSGNFRGWMQFRKMMPGESNFAEAKAAPTN